MAKKIIVEIIRQAGGNLTTTTKLYKAFYAAHLYYASQSPGYLTHWPIVRMPWGPGIGEGEELIEELERIGVLRLETEMVGPYPATKYSLTGKELPGEKLSSEAISAITSAVNFVKDKTATQLSDLTHEFRDRGKRLQMEKN